MFLIHPVFLAAGLAAALSYGIITGGKGTLRFFICFLLPMILLITLINPFVNHQGTTVLFYYTEYRSVTLEAVVYGFLMGLMLAVILLWFSCYNKIMTTDKFVYLFGRIMPAISLLFSMVMRFVPNYKMQITKISDAQKCIGRDVSNGTVKEKIRHGIKIVSIMFTWALENAIDSADSMRSRGYGTKRRTAFNLYRFDGRDRAAAVILVLLTAMVITGVALGRCSMEFYPQISASDPGTLGIMAYISYVVLCFFPVIVEMKEVITWKRLQSKI